MAQNRKKNQRNKQEKNQWSFLFETVFQMYQFPHYVIQPIAKHVVGLSKIETETDYMIGCFPKQWIDGSGIFLASG